VKYILALVFLSAVSNAAEGIASSTAQAIQHAELDTEQCYRVRDLSFQREDVKIYLNEGHLIFLKPVQGRRIAAVFAADVDGGDAELMIFPPHTSERMSLAQFTKSPNLDEHFIASVFLFTDRTGEELLDLLKDSKQDSAAGLVLKGQFDGVVRNIAQSYEMRLVYDLLSAEWEKSGFFFATISGKTLGNFDVLYDRRAREQVLVGQLNYRDDRRFFDTWMSFQSRSVRNGTTKPPENPVVFKNVAIDATLTPDLKMKAKTTIHLYANARTDKVIALELSRKMQLTDVRVNGEPVEFFMRESLRSNLLRGPENYTFLVVLPKPMEAGENRTIEVTHEGNVINSAGQRVYYVGARNNWYPIREGTFSTFDLKFRYPNNLQLVSTGDVVDDRVDGEWRVTQRRVSVPIRFAGFNLGGDYEKASVTRAGFTIDVYANRTVESALQPRPKDYLPQTPAGPRPSRRLQPEPLATPTLTLPPDPKARLRALADEVGAAMEFMSASFGPPPLKTLIVSPIPGTFGQGFPGLLYLSTLAYLKPDDLPLAMRTDSQRRFFSELLHAHETAHQWWGNLVTSGSYQDDWLMEALANYSALLFLEKRKGRRAMEDVLDEYRQHLLASGPEGNTIESAGPIVWGTRLISSHATSSWRAIMYEKGAWIIHMIRVRLGDAAFLKMLNALAQRNRYGRVTTDGFRVLAAEFLPPGSDDPKFESFFEQWVYGTGIPHLKLAHSIKGKPPRVQLQGSITQSSVSEDFSVPIPVEIQMPGKRTTTKWVRSASEPVTFAANLSQAPVKVLIDPYAVLMRR
jgi:hypothetical protein